MGWTWFHIWCFNCISVMFHPFYHCTCSIAGVCQATTAWMKQLQFALGTEDGEEIVLFHSSHPWLPWYKNRAKASQITVCFQVVLQAKDRLLPCAQGNTTSVSRAGQASGFWGTAFKEIGISPPPPSNFLGQGFCRNKKLDETLIASDVIK